MIKDLYMAAILNNHQSLVLLIDFLVNEKKTLILNDDLAKIEYYLQDKFANKMNEYLNEYNLSKKIVNTTNEMNVFQIRLYDTFFYVAAYEKEQAENFFKNEYGEIHEIRIELPELEVEGEDGIHTLKQIIMKTHSFPSVLGYWAI
jgi:hypothetical protein